MIGAIIGSALGAAATGIGQWQASKAAREAKELEQKNYDAQMARNQNWYDRRYNEDGTQRADAQRILAMTQEQMRSANRAARGQAAVSGATEESVAAQKAASADAMADAASKIAVANEARKDNIENQYMNRANALDDAHTKFGVGLEQQRANNITQATMGLTKTLGDLGGAIDQTEWARSIGANGEKKKNG